jgi:hypothetical protein
MVPNRDIFTLLTLLYEGNGEELMRDTRTWIIYEIDHDGERCDLVPRFYPSEVVGSQVSLVLTSVPMFSVNFPFALCSSRQPYNAREFSKL